MLYWWKPFDFTGKFPLRTGKLPFQNWRITLLHLPDQYQKVDSIYLLSSLVHIDFTIKIFSFIASKSPFFIPEID